MISIKYASVEDKDFWFSLDVHLAESEFIKKAPTINAQIIPETFLLQKSFFNIKPSY